MNTIERNNGDFSYRPRYYFWPGYTGDSPRYKFILSKGDGNFTLSCNAENPGADVNREYSQYQLFAKKNYLLLY